ncbi:hypothetical protein [Paracraurococcus ruber]|uniref:Uncharacterized protein n=1 Tax=Paracraurococcus ruber TaxID=77675 RepID=A0ABS1D2X3_9PROT|nr:hypothetical protein [Paracraurococcus ruber]MBK1660980.1 hypothetical protein [Paracraurococcus ruber]
MAHRLGLPEEDPLDGFLRARVEDAGGDPAPGHPLAAPLAEAAAARFGEVWGPGLIAAPGRLHATPTHLDLMLPASALRVELRLAGLDLDPGWVPWLGRVIAFRYEGLPTTSLDRRP